MKLTAENYFDNIDHYMDAINGDPDFLATYKFINKVTANGTAVANLDRNADIRETFDLFLQNLNQLQKAGAVPKQKAKPAVTEKTAKPPSSKKAVTAGKAKPKVLPATAKTDAEIVAHIPSDIALVKRYISLHGKEKGYDQLLAVWRAVNKAITERKVTRGSEYKHEITAMNNSLLAAVNQARKSGSLLLKIPPGKLKVYKAIAESVEKSTGVSVLLEFITLSGRTGMKERAGKLLARIDRLAASGKLKNDRYAGEVEKARQALASYLNAETEVIGLNRYGLNGISEIAVFGCPCKTGDGISGFTRSQNAVVFKLLQEKVKNLRDQELDRAFADTVAPGLCKTVALKLIEAKQLTMTLLRNPAKVSGSFGLGETGSPDGYDFNMEVMDMRLKNAVPGLPKIAVGTPNGNLSGIEERDELNSSSNGEPKLISAMELSNMRFEKIGLKGKYAALIGDPEPGFSGMLYARPFEGKSTLAIDFAKELTTLGPVLYCPYEEGAGSLLQEKVGRNNAQVPRLFFAERLPSDLSPFRFIFIDSVTDAGIDPRGFNALIKANKPLGRTIWGIFHATKNGDFRGGQTYAHDADIVWRIENGILYSKGRYAPNAEMPIRELTDALDAKKAA